MVAVMGDRCRYLLLPAVLLVLAACAAMQPQDSGGSGTSAGSNGRIVRVYPNAYREARQAGTLALGEMGVPRVEDLSDPGGTSIRAVLPGGVPVSVDIVDLGAGRTEVAVRAGRAGQWDDQAARRVQAAIAETLHTLSAPSVRLQPKGGAPTAKAAVAPLPAKKPQQSGGAVKKRTGPRPQFTIFFSANSDELTPAQMKTLDEVARRILATPDASVKLNGYTDSLGDPGYNRMISEARASVVKFYLVTKGVSPAKIRVKGYGARNFIADNRTLAGRQKNRRVEIVISKGPRK